MFYMAMGLVAIILRISVGLALAALRLVGRIVVGLARMLAKAFGRRWKLSGV